MKVYIATITNVDSTEIIGVYTTEDLALGKIEKRMEWHRIRKRYPIFTQDRNYIEQYVFLKDK